MNAFAQQNTKPKSQQAAQSNPFAKALAETERSAYGSGANTAPNSDFLSDAFAKTGSAFPDSFDSVPQQNTGFEQQQAEFLKKQKKEQLRKQLHEKVNPVEKFNIFSAREKQVKKEIDKIRQELKFLIMDAKQLSKDVDLTLMTQIVNPGQEGKYHLSFFQKLRTLIMLFRKQIRSGPLWKHTTNHYQSKKSKAKKRKKGGGLNFSGNESKAVHDTMHHERSTVYSGN